MPTGIYIGIDTGISNSSSGSSWTQLKAFFITEDEFFIITEDNNNIVTETYTE